MNSWALCAANSRSNGMTTSSATPCAAISAALRCSVVSSLGAACGRDHRDGVRLEGQDGVAAGDHAAVAEVDAVEGSHRDAARTRLGVGEGDDLHPRNPRPRAGAAARRRPGSAVAEADDRLEDAILLARLGDRDRPVAVGQQHPGVARTRQRPPVDGRRPPRRPRAPAAAGRPGRPRARAGGRGRRAARRRRPRTARWPFGAARRSARRRGRRSGCARRCPSRAVDPERAAVAVAPELVEARGRSRCARASPRASPARARS